MNREALLLVVAAVVMQLPCNAATLNVPALATALRQAEGYRGRDGAAGERGPWQLTLAVWQKHMPGIPFAQARLEAPARACALKHIEWLHQELQKAGWQGSVYEIALAWNAGLTRTLEGRAPRASENFAVRVVNLYVEAVR